MEIIIFVIILVGAIVYSAVSTKKQKSNSQGASYSAPAINAKQVNIFENNQNKTQNANNAHLQPKQPIKPTIRDHLHGTTTKTSFNSCNKPHDGTYKTDFNVKNLTEEKKLELSEEEIKKLIIIGDAISTPAFKRRKNGMR